MSITEVDFQELDKRLREREDKAWNEWSQEFDMDWDLSEFDLDFLHYIKEEAKNKICNNLELVKEYVTENNSTDEKEISGQLGITECDVLWLLETLSDMGLLPANVKNRIKEQENLFRQNISRAKEYILKTGNDTVQDIAEELKISEEDAEAVLFALKSVGELPSYENEDEDDRIDPEEEDINEKFEELKTAFEELKEEIGNTFDDADPSDIPCENVFSDFMKVLKLLGNSALKASEAICDIVDKSMEQLRSAADENPQEK